jgi:hypothetical protein
MGGEKEALLRGGDVVADVSPTVLQKKALLLKFPFSPSSAFPFAIKGRPETSAKHSINRTTGTQKGVLVEVKSSWVNEDKARRRRTNTSPLSFHSLLFFLFAVYKDW